MTAYATSYRTHTCGELRPEHASPPDPLDPTGEPPVRLAGHVDGLLGDEAFVIRDRYGKTLVALAPEALPHVADRLRKLNPEDVVQVGGRVEARDGASPPSATGEGPRGGAPPREGAEPPPWPADPKLAARGVRLLATRLEVLSEASGVPEGLLAAPEVPLEDRLTLRQLYLRRDEAQARLELRSRVSHALREHLVGEGFLDIESPQLFLFDPVAIGGEVVPVSPTRAYCLAGGPLVLDQYIQPGQFDRFFQIAPITTNEDEDTPLHVQEYTALDLNMCYADVPDLTGAIERALAHVWKAALGKDLAVPFASMTHAEAMLRYGTDKPDLRFGLEIADLDGADPEGRTVRAFVAPSAGDRLADGVLEAIAARLFPDPDAPPPPRDPAKLISEREALEQKLAATAPPPKPTDADPGPPREERPAIAWARIGPGGAPVGPGGAPVGPGAGLLAKPAHLAALGAKAGDLVLLARAKSAEAAAKGAGALRSEIGQRLGLADPARFVPCWVTAHPLFAWREGQYECNVIVFANLLEDKDYEILVKHPERKHEIRTKEFDLVLDGVELASGYVGHHYLSLQRAIWEELFKLEGSDLSRMRAPIEAHRFGVPPHGQLNLGLDRLVARLAGASALDEVMAFPKTHDCRDLFLGAPGPVPREAALAAIGAGEGAGASASGAGIDEGAPSDEEDDL